MRGTPSGCASSPARWATKSRFDWPGLRRSQRRKLGLEGRITVPRWAPLAVRVCIGNVTIRPGSENLAVKMGIGNLTIRAALETVGAVSMRTRIGDASVRGHGRTAESKRRMLGSEFEWTGGEGAADIDAGLRIGNAQIVLE